MTNKVKINDFLKINPRILARRFSVQGAQTTLESDRNIIFVIVNLHSPGGPGTLGNTTDSFPGSDGSCAYA